MNWPKIGCWTRKLMGSITPQEFVTRELERTVRSRLEAESELEAAQWAVKFLREREMRLRGEERKMAQKEIV